MSELDAIESALRDVSRRCRLARALRGLWQGLLVGAILALLLLGVYHVYPLPLWTLMLAGLIPFPCLLAGACWGGWRRLPLQEVARWVDDRQRLKERLSSALEFASDPTSGSWRDLVMADAAHHLDSVDPKRMVPFRLPRVARWAALVLAVGAGLGFVPEYRSKAHLQKQAEQENIKEIGQQLAVLTRRNLERRTPVMEPTQQALESVAELGNLLARQPLTRSDALKDLATASEKLKDELDSFAKDPVLKRLQQAARQGGGSQNQSPDTLQKQIDSLQKQIGNPSNNPEALEKLKRDLEKLQAAAKGMNDPNSPGDTENQKLSDSLSALARQAEDLGLQLPQLDEAIAALAAGKTDLFLKDLNEALQDLEKTQQMAKTLAQLQQQAEQLGKDLAEQLDHGQPEAAENTLRQMAKKLEAANLTPEQLDRILEEVSKAIDPAGNYENVAEHLKRAVQQMKQGNKPAASESLLAAAKELESLMQQLADCQQLAEGLEALREASECIGSCSGWGLGRKPGFKPGGKPGTGVGTWADEENDWTGGWAGGWDNSGVVRPDMDARGLSDRGPGEVSPDLSPTKVKGQFSPGAQMPSITLKGVSIKGQSKVGYEEAAAAAQTEAETALSQEKVPRAYQNAVRDYFDDIK